MLKNYVKKQKLLENMLPSEMYYYRNKLITGTCSSSANALYATTNPDVWIYSVTDIWSHMSGL